VSLNKKLGKRKRKREALGTIIRNSMGKENQAKHMFRRKKKKEKSLPLLGKTRPGSPKRKKKKRGREPKERILHLLSHKKKKKKGHRSAFCKSRLGNFREHGGGEEKEKGGMFRPQASWGKKERSCGGNSCWEGTGREHGKEGKNMSNLFAAKKGTRISP